MGPIEQSMRDAAIAARRRLNANPVSMSLKIPPAPTLRMRIPPASVEKPHKPIADSIDYVIEVPAPLRWKAIVKEVCEKHGITMGQMVCRQRSRPLVAARFEAYYRLSNETLLSLPQIGKLMGGKDHTSVMHGIRVHRLRLAEAEAAEAMQ